jgi:hypothetical protein
MAPWRVRFAKWISAGATKTMGLCDHLALDVADFRFQRHEARR